MDYDPDDHTRLIYGPQDVKDEATTKNTRANYVIADAYTMVGTAMSKSDIQSLHGPSLNPSFHSANANIQTGRPSSAFICIHSDNMDTSFIGGSPFRLGGSAEQQRPLISARLESVARINRRADRHGRLCANYVIHSCSTTTSTSSTTLRHGHLLLPFDRNPGLQCRLGQEPIRQRGNEGQQQKHNRSNRQRQRSSQRLRHGRW